MIGESGANSDNDTGTAGRLSTLGSRCHASNSRTCAALTCLRDGFRPIVMPSSNEKVCVKVQIASDIPDSKIAMFQSVVPSIAITT